MKCNRNRMGLAIAIISAIGLGGCESRAVIPSSYETYFVKNGIFKIKYPVGWEVKGGGANNIAWAEFSSGGAVISIKTNLAGSLLGDRAQASKQMMGNQPVDPSLEPVAVVHEAEKDDFEESEGVKERDPVVITTGFGDSRKSDFTGQSTFGASTRGYRVTALGLDHRIRVVCRCPESEWAALQPAFDQVIESVARGVPQ
jgi:hypothetical protein